MIKLHMTAIDAYSEAVQKTKIKINNNFHPFTMIGWISPSTGILSGPYIVTKLSKTILLQVDANGVIKDTFAAKADNYVPWVK